MFLYQFTNLCNGDQCKIVSGRHPLFGQIVRYKQIEYYFQRPFFVFETMEQERVILESQNEFEVLPYKGSIQDLISLALQMNDKEWFHELVYKLNFESQ